MNFLLIPTFLVLIPRSEGLGGMGGGTASISDKQIFTSEPHRETIVPPTVPVPLNDATEIQNGINEAIKAHDREEITSYFSPDLKYYDCSGNHAFLEYYVDILYEWYPNGPTTEIRNSQFHGTTELSYDMTENAPNAVYKTRTTAKLLDGKWVITNRTAIDC